jgi:uncharacterized protein (DUF1501 family)
MATEPDLVTRRRFLRTSLLGAALTWTVPVFLDRTFQQLHAAEINSALAATTGRDNPILVVLQLAGGNDGLNTVIPFADDTYYRLRPTLAVPKASVIDLDDHLGLNPALTPLKSLFDAGNLAVLQGVGYPNPNRSHFVSTEIWQTGSDSNKMRSNGWIGRYFDNCCRGQPATVGVALGSQLPEAFSADHPTGVVLEDQRLGFRPEPDQVDEQLFAEMNGLETTAQTGASIGAIEGSSHSELTPFDYLQRTALDVQVSTDRISEILKRTKPETTYPPSRLGRDLSLIARLIAGDLPTRVYYASLGGFDTHHGQVGTHRRLLDELAQALAAFCRDLQSKGLFDRVLVMTFSEFGRRVAENASKGTDHGTAAPMLIAGGALKGGLHGRQPGLDHLENGDLIYTTDFRSVYATILARWLKAPVQPILGRQFDALDFV